MDTAKIQRQAKPIVIGAIAGAAVLAIVGFNWGGWVTSGTAKEMTEAAVISQMVPICVSQFNADADKVAKLAKLKKIDSWNQGDYVIKQGWATMPGAKKADDDVARDCANSITN